MVVVFFPLAPILIAILVLVLALLGEASSYANVITTVLWVAEIILSVILIGCNMSRDAKIKDIIAGSVISIAATVVSLI